MASQTRGQGEKEQGLSDKARDKISSESLAVAHCLALVCLVILLILGGSYPKSDFEFSKQLLKCLEQESWAPKAARELAVELDGIATNHKSFDGVESTWSSLVMTLEKHYKEDALWLGYGTGKGQFYSAVNCAAAVEQETDYCRQSKSRFIVKAKAHDVFGDDFVHRFKYVPGGESGGGVFEDLSTGDMPYYPRSRPWFFFGMAAGENGTWGQYSDKATGFKTAAYGVTYDAGVVAGAMSPKSSVCFQKYAPKKGEDALYQSDQNGL